MKIIEIQEDIQEILRLERQISQIRIEMKTFLKLSEREGEIFKLEHSDENYHIRNFGTKEERANLWNKKNKLRNNILQPYLERLEPLEKRLSDIKEKYARYFINIWYDMPLEGASSMVDFLTFAVRIGEDLED